MLQTRKDEILQMTQYCRFYDKTYNISCLPASMIASTDLSKFNLITVSEHSHSFPCMLKKTLSNLLMDFTLPTPDVTPYSSVHNTTFLIFLQLIETNNRLFCVRWMLKVHLGWVRNMGNYK